MYEPWHYRYVGVEHAKEIMSRGICLEAVSYTHLDVYKRQVGSQAVSYTTGVPAMIGAMLVMTGKWQRPGVYNVEEFDPDPFMDALNQWGLPWKESFDPQMVD